MTTYLQVFIDAGGKAPAKVKLFPAKSKLLVELPLFNEGA